MLNCVLSPCETQWADVINSKQEILYIKQAANEIDRRGGVSLIPSKISLRLRKKPAAPRGAL